SRNTSLRSARVPTIEPRIVIPLRTVSKIGSWTALSAGRATKTSLPPRRNDRYACSNAFGATATAIAASAPPRSLIACTGSSVAVCAPCSRRTASKPVASRRGSAQLRLPRYVVAEQIARRNVGGFEVGGDQRALCSLARSRWRDHEY